jgi:hypothetical protein
LKNLWGRRPEVDLVVEEDPSAETTTDDSATEEDI